MQIVFSLKAWLIGFCVTSGAVMVAFGPLTFFFDRTKEQLK